MKRKQCEKKCSCLNTIKETCHLLQNHTQVHKHAHVCTCTHIHTQEVTIFILFYSLLKYTLGYQLMTDKMTDGMEIKLSNKKISFWWLLNFIIWNHFWDIQKAVGIFMASITRCYERSVWKASSKLHYYFHRTQLKTVIIRSPLAFISVQV